MQTAGAGTQLRTADCRLPTADWLQAHSPEHRPIRLAQTPAHHPAPAGAGAGTDQALEAQAAGGGDGVIRIYEIDSGALIQTLRGHTSWVQEARFHPDGQRLVSTSWDGTVRLWDTESGRELRQFTGHNGHTFGTAFSDDGELLMTTSEDTTVRLWEVASGEELHRYRHTDWIQEVVFSPDETFAVSGGQDDTARIWRVDRTASELVEFAQDIRFIRDLSCAEREVYRLEPCATTE